MTTFSSLFLAVLLGVYLQMSCVIESPAFMVRWTQGIRGSFVFFVVYIIIAQLVFISTGYPTRVFQYELPSFYSEPLWNIVALVLGSLFMNTINAALFQLTGWGRTIEYDSWDEFFTYIVQKYGVIIFFNLFVPQPSVQRSTIKSQLSTPVGSMRGAKAPRLAQIKEDAIKNAPPSSEYKNIYIETPVKDEAVFVYGRFPDGPRVFVASYNPDKNCWDTGKFTIPIVSTIPFFWKRETIQIYG